MRGTAHREHFRAVRGDQNSYDIPFPYAVVTQRMEYLEDGTVQFGT
jgi:hypothetical protein